MLINLNQLLAFVIVSNVQYLVKVKVCCFFHGRYVAMRGSMREYSASESVMLQRMWIEKEKRELKDDREAVDRNPGNL